LGLWGQGFGYQVQGTEFMFKGKGFRFQDGIEGVEGIEGKASAGFCFWLWLSIIGLGIKV